MEQLKYKVNLVAAIAVVGAALALIGILMSFFQFPKAVKTLDLVIFVLLVIVALSNLKPSTDWKGPILNVVVGIMTIAIVAFDYVAIGSLVDAKSFMDVGLGIWMAFAGTIIFTIFSLSDLIYKKRQ